MRSTNRPYLYSVDHLRAGAAILVLLYHGTRIVAERIDPDVAGGSVGGWLYSRNPAVTVIFEGHTGVALFMVLSGFIFTLGTNGADVQYWPYLRNRLLRIYPLYLLLLLFGFAEGLIDFDPTTLALAIVPVSNFVTLQLGWWGAMFWAVAVEVQFYLVFPFLLRFLNRWGPMALVRIIGALLVLRTLAVLSHPGAVDINLLTYSSLTGRLDQFLLGMLAAWAFTNRRRLFSPTTLGACTVAAVAMMWAFNQTHWYAEPDAWRAVWVDVEGIVWALFIGSYVATIERFRGRLSRALARVGEMSYSIYLLHVVVIGLVVAHPGMWLHVGGTVSSGLATAFLVVLPITLLVAVFTYHGVEKPFLSLRGSYRRRQDVPLGAGDGGAADEPAGDAPARVGSAVR